MTQVACGAGQSYRGCSEEVLVEALRKTQEGNSHGRAHESPPMLAGKQPPDEVQ